MAYDPRTGLDTGAVQLMYEEGVSPEAWKDIAPIDQDWLKDYRAGSFGSVESAIRDGGMAPTNNLVWTGQGAPPSAAPGPDGKKPNGFWNYTGQAHTGIGGGDSGPMRMDSSYQWVEQQAPAAPVAAAPQERVPDAKPDEDRPTIYDSFDDYIDIARREDQGRNRMPFVYGGGYGEGQPTYQDVPYDPILALEQVYPSGRNAFRADLRDPLKGEQLKPYGDGGMGGFGGTNTGQRGGNFPPPDRSITDNYGGMSSGKEALDPTLRSGFYPNYGAPGYVGPPAGGYGGVPAPAKFGTTYANPRTSTGYAALPTYRAR